MSAASIGFMGTVCGSKGESLKYRMNNLQVWNIRNGGYLGSDLGHISLDQVEWDCPRASSIIYRHLGII
jgi:hypothetical protein